MRFSAISLCLVLGLTFLPTDAAGLVAAHPGVIEFDGTLVQISVQQGRVSFNHDRGQSLDSRLAELAGRIEAHLAATEQQEERQFSDIESLHRGTNYGKKLVAKIELLSERLAYLGREPVFTSAIESAAAAFDVPLIKKHLQGKLALEDENVAEAAFQLAGFQELDGEYQDAWRNYQKASNLEPDNQLYMDAHGKNEF